MAVCNQGSRFAESAVWGDRRATVRALVETFLWTRQFEAVDPKRAELQSSWVDIRRAINPVAETGR